MRGNRRLREVFVDMNFDVDLLNLFELKELRIVLTD
jgi:hypothetical protein